MSITRNQVLTLLVALAVGFAVGSAIRYFRGVEQAPLVCMFGSVAFSFWRIRRR